ncbi:MAG TPA: peptidase MA family metallohydrolase [Anaerolineales bacterium]|nr:peptidase MA family metallohydrolase [Anaerolineales bacterium]HNN12464.1 peptidase MA family metallohydrolase [Anaerolineales bacterium]
MSTTRRWITKCILVALLGLTLFLKPDPVHGQGGIVVESPAAVIDFGKSITFTAKINASSPVQEAYVLFRGVTETTERVEKMQLIPDGTYLFMYDASLNVFPPFSWLVYWFQATLADGQTYTSEPLQVQYRDDRFPWQHISQANITVNWYAGDEAFGQAALGSAGAGLLSMKDLLPISLTDPIDIYIYSNIDDLQATLMLGGQTWAGGHAHAELGVVLVAISPGVSQYTDMDTLIPHELAHVMIYRALGDNYAKQPAWLVEGISSMAELYPNPEYARALEIASANDTLLPFESLCDSFPADSGSAFLAYAQSQSFVSYIRDSFGIPGLTRLMNTYTEGYSCDLGVAQALSLTLGQLDQRWRETVLGQNVGGVALRNLLPFLLLLVLVLLVPLWGAIDVMRKRRKKENGKPAK